MQPHKSERKALMSLELEQVKVDAHKRSKDQFYLCVLYIQGVSGFPQSWNQKMGFQALNSHGNE